MVTFDKGGRVPRLEPGVHLDARQVGILLAKAKTVAKAGADDVIVRITSYREDKPGAPRLADEIAGKGADHPQVALLGLGLDLLVTFEVLRPSLGQVFKLEGSRAHGYTVSAAHDMMP